MINENIDLLRVYLRLSISISSKSCEVTIQFDLIDTQTTCERYRTSDTHITLMALFGIISGDVWLCWHAFGLRKAINFFFFAAVDTIWTKFLSRFMEEKQQRITPVKLILTQTEGTHNPAPVDLFVRLSVHGAYQ